METLVLQVPEDDPSDPKHSYLPCYGEASMLYHLLGAIHRTYLARPISHCRLAVVSTPRQEVTPDPLQGWSSHSLSARTSSHLSANKWPGYGPKVCINPLED